MTADVHLLAKDTNSSVAAVCRALELPRSSVYERRSRQPSRRAQDTALLDVEVAALHQESKQRYGSPRIHRALPVIHRQHTTRSQVISLPRAPLFVYLKRILIN